MSEFDPKVPASEPEKQENSAQDEATIVFKSTSKQQGPVRKFAGKVSQVASDVDYILLGDEKKNQPPVRQKTRRWGCLGAAMYFLFVVSTAALIAIVGWQAACDVLGLRATDLEAEIEITAEDDLSSVARKLKDAGMIEYKSVFKLYGRYSHAMDKIEPGTYTLSDTYDYRALVSGMRHYETLSDVVEVTIPEGYNVDQIFTLLDSEGVCLKSDLETIASEYEFDYDFLANVPYGNPQRLEGYLFPDTYEFYVGGDPVSTISKLLDNFKAKMNEEIMQAVAESGYSLRDIVIIASLIEKEAKVSTDRELVASVIYNRLGSSSISRLQIDATVVYAFYTMGQIKDVLTYEDLEVDSLYNTYKYEGLPPGPISNPGIAAIKAAINPASTNYYFYALKSDGSHYFSRTYEEHQNFLASQGQ